MPKDSRARTRAGRARMAATGEKYTQALAAVTAPRLNRNPADATTGSTTVEFAQLMAAGAKAKAFPSVYPGGAGAVVREAVTALWPQVTPAAVATTLCACTSWIVTHAGAADVLAGWGSISPVAEAMLRTATWTEDGRWAAARTWVDTEPEAEVLAATWTLLALAHQRTPEDNAADEAAVDWDWDDGTCPECGGELRGKGTYGCECYNPSACSECGDPDGRCDCWI